MAPVFYVYYITAFQSVKAGDSSFLIQNIDFFSKFVILTVTHFGAPGCHHNTVGGFSPLARGRLKALCFHRALLRRKSVAQGVTRVTAFEIITIILAALTLLVSIIGIIVKLIIELINAKK